jgi:hypothetical protein
MSAYLWCPKCGALIHKAVCDLTLRAHLIMEYLTSEGEPKEIVHYNLIEED